MKVSCVAEMRELDRTAIEKYGIADALLMENAGLAVYAVLLEQTGIKGKRFVVFCGGGNNGGDGLVVARKLHSNGGEVKVFLLSNPEKFKGSAKANFEIASRLPIEMQRVESLDAIKSDVLHSEIIVDAIFGTGLTREVGGLYREVIELINRSNRSGKTVLSVDIPSGVHGDTGHVMGVAVRADYTVTFGLPKIGNLLYPGYELGGRLYVTHISFPPKIYTADALKIAINHPPKLPPRNAAGHKKTFGEALFIAGASSYYGAPYFAALSFMKAGGGYARLAAPKSVTRVIAAKGSEIVFAPQQETAAGSISLANRTALLELAQKMQMVVIGPGLSLDDEAQQLTRQLTAEIDRPLLLDGDGITALSQDLDIIRHRPAETILTPHLGEMSRLTGLSAAEIAADSVPVLQRAAADLGAIIVLKGAHSLTGYPDARVFINMSGNSGMASAGSGDVLSGTIAAMFGLGLSPDEAARMGVFIHGLSGDLAANDKGEDGITAQDILDYLPLAVKTTREGLSEALQDRYIGARVV
ncbi:MAG TPA: NAD(P)H-hydrate dehydratase [Chloroflexi bacterium]|nr:NAD(P)H-hydrate dehydratase [Chloroflexota bacterium]